MKETTIYAKSAISLLRSTYGISEIALGVLGEYGETLEENLPAVHLLEVGDYLFYLMALYYRLASEHDIVFPDLSWLEFSDYSQESVADYQLIDKTTDVLLFQLAELVKKIEAHTENPETTFIRSLEAILIINTLLTRIPHYLPKLAASNMQKLAKRTGKPNLYTEYLESRSNTI